MLFGKYHKIVIKRYSVIYFIIAVYLRKKTLSGGRKSYYLDIWHNEKRHYEFLKLYIVKAKTPIDKKQNERDKELAENIRAKREIDLQALDHDFIPKFKRDTDFLAYFENFKESYQNKDIRLVKRALKHFKEFLKESEIKYLPVKSLDEQLCREFKNYHEGKVHGETISNYNKKFRSVIQKAVKKKLIFSDVTAAIKIVKSNGLKKDILTLQ